ncbi:cytochrome P450 [Streptomyces sp. HNM0663]|uniref:Cytochrome P450 n=1 Tax=Streptomyces chengmaiensis TaxID=3040919 RepID=A0ABT6HID6_9ACTN|nr:cytochrome P450 [Streptomyces chengmaiensis]MDH2387804.1 cytochrome P450 [Streptomyces chengmaiensis]
MLPLGPLYRLPAPGNRRYRRGLRPAACGLRHRAIAERRAQTGGLDDTSAVGDAQAAGDRQAAETTPAGWRLPAGTALLCSAYPLQHRPELFPDPERPDPERFDPGRRLVRPGDGLPWGAHAPFGGGSRKCIGDQFVLIEMTMALVPSAGAGSCAPSPEIHPARPGPGHTRPRPSDHDLPAARQGRRRLMGAVPCVRPLGGARRGPGPWRAG